jgi:mRNA-degrading endonuclease RelE of RelBE toxin-antitoxin system
MAWSIRLTRQAERELAKLPRDRQRQIKAAMERMKEDPFRGKVKPLKGREWKGVYRRVVGPYRLFFLPRHEQQTVYIVSIQRRTEKTYR